ncbi:hypothetical protein [Cupriavidus sp. UME77]|nr:hypothetical protein [Cupriavidus sp. UME77]
MVGLLAMSLLASVAMAYAIARQVKRELGGEPADDDTRRRPYRCR